MKSISENKNELILLRKELEDKIKSIDSKLRDLEWIECQNKVKDLPDNINKSDLNQILYTRLLADRFMVNDVSKHMRELENELTGNIKKGYSLNQIRDAFVFFKNF